MSAKLKLDETAPVLAARITWSPAPCVDQHGYMLMTDDIRRKGSAMPITRGFVGHRRPLNPRLPPGQSDVGDGFPVLTAEVAPTIDTATWTMTVDGLVDKPNSWTWGEIHELPGSEYKGDIHCVTTWSKFDTSFGGLSVDVLLDAAVPKPTAAFVLATSVTGYTTNLPLEDIKAGKAWIVWSHEGAPLPVIHGGPIRLLVPHLYFWKSAKWISKLTLLADDELGFWEQNGYHLRGDPWKQQRYTGD